MRSKYLVLLVAGLGFLAFLYWTALPGDFVVGGDVVDSDRTGLVGAYTVNGVDPTGVEYSGTAFITEGDTTDKFNIQWLVTGAIQEGTARRQADRLIVDWEATSSAGGTGRGTGDYTIEADGRLVGIRTIDGSDGVGSETLFPEA